MSYKPDNWVIIKVNGDNPHYRVLAGWSGGYTTGDSWRMNSGVLSVSTEEDYYLFKGSSGSTYKCHKDSYGLRINNQYVWNSLKDKYKDKVELMDEDTDWLNMDWIL